MTVTLPDRSADNEPRAELLNQKAEFAFSLRPGRVALALGLCSLMLTLANPLSKLVESAIAWERHRGLAEIAWRFDFDFRNSIEIWFSSATLLVAAVLYAVVALAKRQNGGTHVFHWALLATGFVYLSLDETIKLHKVVILPLCRRAIEYGLPFYSWVVPGGLLVLGLALVYRTLLLELDRRIRRLILASAAVYLGGALGVETLSGLCSSWYGIDSLRYVLASTVEEALEMAGIVLFIYTLLVYLEQELESGKFASGDPGRRQRLSIRIDF